MSNGIVVADRHLMTVNTRDAMQRLATFLLDQSKASQRNGCSATRFTLAMSRTDIANYLNLALETVSRLLAKLKLEHLVDIDRNDVNWLDLTGLAGEVRGAQ